MSCRYRVKVSGEILGVAKEEWNPPNPAGIHWDIKIMQTNMHLKTDCLYWCQVCKLIATKQFYNKTCLLINILSQFLRFETSWCYSIASTQFRTIKRTNLKCDYVFVKWMGMLRQHFIHGVWRNSFKYRYHLAITYSQSIVYVLESFCL